MSRVPRCFQYSESGCYHILNRGHNRETVFRDERDFETFLSLLGRYRERFGFKLFHYCLMSNHFHLLLQLPEPRDLSPLMAGLLRSYVHYYHGRYQFVGHLWQGRFKSPAVQKETYLSSCGRYIERNPLEAGIVEEPWDYRWSSCGHYALGQAVPVQILIAVVAKLNRYGYWPPRSHFAELLKNLENMVAMNLGDPLFKFRVAWMV